MKNFVIVLAVATVLMLSSNAVAQTVIVGMPVGPVPVATYYAAPAVTVSPVVTTAYYAPAPYYVAAPVATPYYVAAPVVAPYPALAPVYYGRAVIVRPKVYVVGQPVRNVLRAVTP